MNFLCQISKPFLSFFSFYYIFQDLKLIMINVSDQGEFFSLKWIFTFSKLYIVKLGVLKCE